MSEMARENASCLCGSVRITAKNRDNNVGSCHCNMCKKWSGGPIMAVNCGSEVHFEGEENITIFSSSDWAERGFCNKCGSHLFYRLKANNLHMISAGLFENRKEFVFDRQVFFDEKPDFYNFSNETNNMTGAEVFALYARGS